MTCGRNGRVYSLLLLACLLCGLGLVRWIIDAQERADRVAAEVRQAATLERYLTRVVTERDQARAEVASLTAERIRMERALLACEDLRPR